MGIINYLAKFYPRLSEESEPLTKNTAWVWLPHHEEAFNKIKITISEATLLKYLDEKKPPELRVDANDHGLGALLIQDKQPIAYASRTLKPAEKNYAPIEKEMLAIVFGLTKFYDYTYGRHIHIISNHQPLKVIVNKPLKDTPKSPR